MNTRWGLIISLAAICALLASAAGQPTLAATPESAQAFIKSISDEAISALADKNLDDKARIEKLRKVFVGGFDTRTIGRFVVGRHWRTASKAQLKEYGRLFNDFVVQTYAKRLGEYAGETLLVKNARVNSSDGDVIVASEIERTSGPLVRVDWRVRDGKEGHKIVDVVVEGVSMLITQRDEFSAVIRSNGGNFEGLLVALRAKTKAP